jgi:hypothetical protein
VVGGRGCGRHHQLRSRGRVYGAAIAAYDGGEVRFERLALGVRDRLGGEEREVVSIVVAHESQL